MCAREFLQVVHVPLIDHKRVRNVPPKARTEPRTLTVTGCRLSSEPQ